MAVNWDPLMAVFMVFDSIRGSLKYGTNTFIPVELEQLTIKNGDIKKASRYEPVSFYMLEKLLGTFRKISTQTSVIDLGCGKGRMMMVAPHYGFKNITGIDFAREMCEQATINMSEKMKQFPAMKWKVINENVLDYSIGSADSAFFMFNPFAEEVLRDFLKKLDDSCHQFPRTVHFLYASPQYQRLLLDNGYAIIYQKQKMHIKGIIAVRE
ncbi:MAG TPA: class I SAM-dependent methyltransferase [Chitinophagaceae bacterium]